LTTQVFGFDAEFHKENNLVDRGDGPYQHLVVANYTYSVTIHGDLGEWLVYHYDGLYLRWRRVSWDGEKAEYVAMGRWDGGPV
jgi:hypothetical protein